MRHNGFADIAARQFANGIRANIPSIMLLAKLTGVCLLRWNGPACALFFTRKSGTTRFSTPLADAAAKRG
jgi:hypothetical protein